MPGSVTAAVTCIANEGSPGEVKPGDLSVRENEQNLPSVRRALKKQGWRPVVCYLLRGPGANTAEKTWLNALRTK